MRFLGLLACAFSAMLVLSIGSAAAGPAPSAALAAAVWRWGLPMLAVIAVACLIARLRGPLASHAAAVASVVFVAVFVWPAFAYAQAAADPGTTINAGALFSDVRGTLETVFGVVVGGVVALAGWLVKKNLGISIDQKYRDALQTALVNGLHSGFDLVQARADEISFDVKSELVAKALRYARAFAPAAIKHFGLSDTDLSEMARAQLAKMFPAEALAAPVSSGPLR